MQRIAASIIVIALCAAPAAAFGAAEKPQIEKISDSPDTLICKRFLETGSLIATRKICGTKEEWQKSREELHQRGLDAMNGCRTQSEGKFC